MNPEQHLLVATLAPLLAVTAAPATAQAKTEPIAPNTSWR